MRTKDFDTAKDLLLKAGFKLTAHADAKPYFNLLRASVGENPHHWRYIMAAFEEAKTLSACEAGAYPVRMNQVLLGSLCLKLGYGKLYDFITQNGLTAEDVDFFENASDPAFYTDIYNDGLTADYAALFMQGFYNLIADTGHVITPAHMQSFLLAMDLSGKLAPLPGIRRAAIDDAYWHLRRQNRTIIKTANAALQEMFPAYPFRVFQQDYGEDGVLAVNATAYRDFDTVATDFVLDCRLETDLERLTTNVALVLFCRRDKFRFVQVFRNWPQAGELGFALEPEHKWFIRGRVLGVNANDTTALTVALADEVKQVLPKLLQFVSR